MEVTIKKVENGFVVSVFDHIESKEYIFARESQVLRFLRDQWKDAT